MAGGIFGYFLRQYRVTFLLIAGLTIVGLSTVAGLPRESAPEINVPFAQVVTIYPGASALDVEELVTDKVEEKVSGVEGVKEVLSASRLGLSSVSVEFAAEEDIDQSLQRLRDAVDTVAGLPSEAEDPQVVEINFASEPIISVSIGGLEDTRLLTIQAERLADDIEEISGVSEVNVVGARAEQITVSLNLDRLTSLGLSPAQVVGTLSAANLNAPLGQLESDQFKYDLRLSERFTSVSDVSNTLVVLPGGEKVPLDNIADVRWELAPQNSEARVSVGQNPSTPSVSLSVRKKSGGNIVNIIDEINSKIEVAQKTYLPDAVTIQTFADRADDIRSSLSNVFQSGMQTLIIVFIILSVFIGWKEALIAASAIPMTFFISFVVFDITGITLNGISLFSLILSLGLLVDNAIIIIEGIHERENDDDLFAHAAHIIDRFKKPLIGGTLTTVAAFFPMLLVSGIIGEFLRTIPIVVSATLVASLFVALALIPPVAVLVLKKWPRSEEPRWFDEKFEIFADWYKKVITSFLISKRRQKRFIGLLALMLVVGLALPFTGLLKTSLFPAVDINFAIVNVELPPGTRLEETQKVMKLAEEKIISVPEISSYSANSGSSTSVDLGGGSSSENLGSFFINLEEKRDRSSLEINEDLREEFSQSKYSPAKISVQEVSAGPPTAPPVEVRIVGPEINVLSEISTDVQNILVNIEGATEVDSNLDNNPGEFSFVFNYDALAENQLTPADLTAFLRTAVFGQEATSFLDKNGDEIKVQVEAAVDSVASPDQVLALSILNRAGQEVPLNKIARLDLNTSFSTIRRQDGERSVAVNANAAQGFNANEITQTLEQKLSEYELPANYRFEFGGEQEETVQTFTELYQSMFISVILVLIILVVEFNSYKQPLVIFLSIPMSLIGVLYGLLIVGGELNFAAFIGLISLVGIVVNDSIILVDRMNTLLKQGMELTEAVVAGATSRLQPVILTTLTTAGGVAPLIWVDEFFRDMALTIITGLLFASVLTLVFVPILYLRQQKKLLAKSVG